MIVELAKFMVPARVSRHKVMACVDWEPEVLLPAKRRRSRD